MGRSVFVTVISDSFEIVFAKTGDCLNYLPQKAILLTQWAICFVL